MPNPAEIAAYIGAAAWLPQIATWVYRRFVPPKLRIIPQRQVELGFTTFGPIFNVRLSLAADQKDAIIEHMAVRLRHEHGEVHTLEWTGLRETFSEITDSEGYRQLVERDQPAIALKVSTQLLLEKFVRFQDVGFHERHEQRVTGLLTQHRFLKSSSQDYRAETLQSKELHDLLEFYKTEFWWRPGRYIATFSIQSSNRAKLHSSSFQFEMASYDVDTLRGNLDVLRSYLSNLVMEGAEGYERLPVVWSWRTLALAPASEKTLAKPHRNA